MRSVPDLACFRAETVLLVGSGRAAESVVLRLADSGARVRWVSPDVDVAEAIWLSAHPDRIEIAVREPLDIDVASASAVIATVGEPVAGRMSEQARALGRPVAVLGHPELSTFDLDDFDDSGAGGIRRPQWRIGVRWRRASEWLSTYMSRGAAVLAALPSSFGG